MGCCEGGVTTALEPSTSTLAVATVVIPTRDTAAITVLVAVAPSAEGRCDTSPNFMGRTSASSVVPAA